MGRSRIRNERRHIMSDLTEIKSESERRYYEQLYPYKLDKLDELGEKAKATHSSTLAWSTPSPWTEEPGRLQSMGSRRVRHD